MFLRIAKEESWSSLTHKCFRKIHMSTWNNSFWISNFRWKEVVQWVKDKLSITYSLAFSYFDDEGDLIFVSVHVLHDDIWALYNLTYQYPCSLYFSLDISLVTDKENLCNNQSFLAWWLPPLFSWITQGMIQQCYWKQKSVAESEGFITGKWLAACFSYLESKLHTAF